MSKRKRIYFFFFMKFKVIEFDAPSLFIKTKTSKQLILDGFAKNRNTALQ